MKGLPSRTNALHLFVVLAMVGFLHGVVASDIDRRQVVKFLERLKLDQNLRDRFHGGYTGDGHYSSTSKQHLKSTLDEKLEHVDVEALVDSGMPFKIPFDQWLIDQAKVSALYPVTRYPGGFADTPLGNISELCYNETIQTINDLEKGVGYAVAAISSWGDFDLFVERYEYYGKPQDLGLFDLCMEVKKENSGSDADALIPIDAQYCTLDVFSGLTVGTCFPVSCSESDLTVMAYTYLGFWWGIILTPYYICEHPVDWWSGSIATVSVISFFALIVVAATTYHLIAIYLIKGKLTKSPSDLPIKHHLEPTSNGYAQEVTDEISTSFNGNAETKFAKEEKHNYESIKKTEGITIEENEKEEIQDKEEVRDKEAVDKDKIELDLTDQLILSSSAIHNTKKFLDCTVTSPTTLCLNGLRVLSMFWVILGHTNMFLPYVRLENIWRLAEQSTEVTFKAVSESPFGVDTFFFLSGLLVSYLTLKQLSKNKGSFTYWVIFYFHRYWRITPLYMVTLAVWMNLWPLWGDGPMKYVNTGYIYETCKDLWWTHFVYINNLYPFPGDVNVGTCMGWTWYLANDMQFFIISPFLLYLLYKSWKAGVVTIIVLCLISFGSTIYLTTYWGLGFADTGYYNNRTELDPRPGNDYIYGKPYHRIPPYLIGILFGYMLYKLNGRTIAIKWWANIIGWFVAAAVAMSVVYIPAATSPSTPQWAAVLYQTFSRTFFALSVAWVAFSCIMGYGGFVNTFLSWSIWIPLGRLTFGAYLLHPIVIYWMLYTKKDLFHWSYVSISYLYVSNIVFSYAVAFIFALLIEGPTGGLEDVLLGNRRRGRGKTS